MFQEVGLRLLSALQSVRTRFQDDQGQTLAEYGLIMAVIAVAVVIIAVVAFRGAIVSAFNNSTKCLSGSC
jgi:Flp pilus assembly pilin Flp